MTATPRRRCGWPPRRLRRLQRATVAAVTLAAAGCTLAPPYQRPAAPVPSTFVAGQAAAPQERAADIPWEEFFQDERLRRLIGLALEHNRDLRVAVLTIEQTRAQYQISRAALFPAVQAGASYSRQYLEQGAGAGITTSTWGATVGVTAYELDLFGRVRSQNAQALEQYFATEEAQRAAQVSLVSEVAIRYFTLRQAQEQLRLANETLASVQRSYAINKATFDAGQSNELDLRQSESQVENAQISILTYERQVAEALHALELLLGTALPADLPPPRPFEDPGLMPIPAGLPSDLVARRPDILQAEHTLKAAHASIAVARAAFFPSITLTGSGGFSSPELSSLFKPGSREWSLLPQISVPIFTGGQNRAQLQSARAGEQIQIANYEKAIQTAFREVADALVDADSYARQITRQRALIATQRRRLELATLRYAQGEDSYLNELTAQQDLYNAEQALLQAQLNKLSSQIALYRALGGGWK